MHECYRGGTDCAGGFVLLPAGMVTGIINVTAAAGIEPESATALSSGVDRTGEGGRKAIADNRTNHLAGSGLCHHNRVASDGRSVNTEAPVGQIARS
jgi:hypothetical protein